MDSKREDDIPSSAFSVETLHPDGADHSLGTRGCCFDRRFRRSTSRSVCLSPCPSSIIGAILETSTVNETFLHRALPRPRPRDCLLEVNKAERKREDHVGGSPYQEDVF